jgi:hypothetical protein
LPKLEWPMRSCREPVWTEYIAHTCELPEEHRGPCASNSVPSSLQRREAWEEAQKPLPDEQKDVSA